MLNQFIQKIINDSRMNRLFYGNEKTLFQAWVLRIKEKETIYYHWLYGRVLSYDNNRLERWEAKFDKNYFENDIKFSIISLQFTTYAENFKKFILNLVQNNSFLAASSETNINFDEKLNEVLSLLKLSTPYCIRPVLHLPPRDIIWGKGKVSPDNRISYDSAAISIIKKKDFWEELGVEKAKSILEKVANKLILENIDIRELDSWRFGDLEFLVSPSCTNKGKIKYNFKDSHENILEIYEHISYYPLIIILKIFNSDCLLETLITEVKITDYPFKLKFNIDESYQDIFCSYHLEIYEKNENKTILLIQEGNYFLRKIDIRIIVGNELLISNKDPWLNKGVSKNLLEQARKLNSINRLSSYYMKSIVSGRYLDLWYQSNFDIQCYLTSILPTQSKSKFFSKLSINNKSRLEFVEWLKKELKNEKYANAQIAWFDPFMEDAGINLLNKLGTNSTNYIIFTSQNNKQNTRIENLRKQCEIWQENDISINLKVMILEQLHDRMLLIRGEDGRPLDGYHFSNSIQRANEKNPLLITQIPVDTLYLVFDYLDNLIQTQDIVTIFDSKTYFPKYKEPNIKSSPYQFLKLGLILSRWWNKPDLKLLTGNLLENELIKLNLEFSVSRNKYTEIPSKVWKDIFLSKDFIEEWDAFGELLAHIPSSNSFIINDKTISTFLVKNLLIYLNSQRCNTLPIRKKVKVINLEYYLDLSFEKLVCFNKPEHVFSYNSIESSFSDYYAIKVLWCNFPDELIRWLEIELENYDKENTRQLALIIDSMRYLWNNVFCLDKSIILFKSRHRLLQWIGLNKLISFFFSDDIDEKLLCSIIESHHSINNDDKIKVFLLVIRKLVSRNKKLNSNFLVGIISILNGKTISDEKLKNILYILYNGRNYGYWILGDILEPMVNKKIITYSQIINVFLNELEIKWKKALNNPDEYINFILLSEGNLSNSMISIFRNLDVSEQYEIIERLNKIINILERSINLPLLSSINYVLYVNGYIISFWILAILNNLENYGLSDSSQLEIGVLKNILNDICQRYNLIDVDIGDSKREVLKYYFDSII